MDLNYPYNKITKYYISIEDKRNLNGRLVRLEEKFLFAYICWKRLKDRSARYNKVLDSVSVEDVLSNVQLRELHADEHFFFQCCGDIYKEVQHQLSNNTFTIPDALMAQLKILKDERRVHTHGVDWYWGKIDKNNPPVPSRGDNYDFDSNIGLLNLIYSSIVIEICQS